MFSSEYQYVSLEDLDMRRFAQEDPRGFLQKYSEKVIFDEASQITATSTGNIILNGTGQSGSSSYGVRVRQGADITNTGTGSISITGAAGDQASNAYGVYVTQAGSTVSTTSGALSL